MVPVETGHYHYNGNNGKSEMKFSDTGLSPFFAVTGSTSRYRLRKLHTTRSYDSRQYIAAVLGSRTHSSVHRYAEETAERKSRPPWRPLAILASDNDFESLRGDRYYLLRPG